LLLLYIFHYSSMQGLQTQPHKRPKRVSLHLARSFADPGARFCRFRGAGLLTTGARVCKRQAGLQTPGVRVCTQCAGLHTQESGFADPRHAGLHLACRSADPSHASLQIRRLSLDLALSAWQPQHQMSAAPPKSELTIFSPSQIDNFISSQSLQLYVIRTTLPLYCFNSQYCEMAYYKFYFLFY
jgi:hypothetical protein